MGKVDPGICWICWEDCLKGDFGAQRVIFSLFGLSLPFPDLQFAISLCGIQLKTYILPDRTASCGPFVNGNAK